MLGANKLSGRPDLSRSKRCASIRVSSERQEDPMAAQTVTAPTWERSHRFAGICAIVLALSYVGITLLYVQTGALPSTAEERLTHLHEHTSAWWAILALSVATDLLFVPILWSLYMIFKDSDRNAMLAGCGLVGLFVVLD